MGLGGSVQGGHNYVFVPVFVYHDNLDNVTWKEAAREVAGGQSSILDNYLVFHDVDEEGRERTRDEESYYGKFYFIYEDSHV